MTDDDTGRRADFMSLGGEAETQRLDAQQVDLLLEDPASIVSAEAGWLHEGHILEIEEQD